MGIHGLTTYLRENRRSLATSPSSSEINVVVDGWSFIYEVYQKSGLPWVYGGEYQQYSALIASVVNAWLAVGFRLYFVFDGPYPEPKFTTVITRTTQTIIQPSQLFFRTSSVSRSSPRFLFESRIIPPSIYTATILALQSLKVEIYFADEEADPFSVELAGRLSGYVMSNDSDFVVLNTDGYQGFIPFEDIVWNTSGGSESSSLLEPDDGEFQAVRRKKKPKEAKLGRGIIPPENSHGLSISFTVYSPLTLATHLKLPVTLLPLVGALVGNDFSNSRGRNIHQKLFDRHSTSSQRINRVATVIQAILLGEKRGSRHRVDSVMSLINQSVKTLLSSGLTIPSSGEIESITDAIVESTLQYAIPRPEGDTNGTLWPSPICPLHPPNECTLLTLFSRLTEAELSRSEDKETETLVHLDNIRSRYVDSYRAGKLAPTLLNCLNSGTFWPRLFLESPDVETVSLIGQPIRQWCYSLLDDGVGIPRTAAADQNESTGSIDEDGIHEEAPSETENEDELIDVVENDSDQDSDLLAPLKGALNQLHGDGPQAGEPPEDSLTVPFITEYVRRGGRLAEESVTILPLKDLLQTISMSTASPVTSAPQEDRLTILLRVLDSDSDQVRLLKPQQAFVVLALRWVTQTLHQRAQERPGKERDAARWSLWEVQCFLASFDWQQTNDSVSSINEAPSIVDRNIQLVAQVLHIFESIECFTQVLLLTERVQSPVHLFSGRRFHSYLTKSEPLPELPVGILDAVIHDLLGSAIATEKRQKNKKKDSRKEAAAPLTKAVPKTATSSQSMLFALLDVQ